MAAPSSSGSGSGSGGNSRKRRRTHESKKQAVLLKSSEASMEVQLPCESSIRSTSPTTTTTTTTTTSSHHNPYSKDGNGIIDDDVSNESCSTPKAQRFRIPELLSCPPAPKKKRRVLFTAASSKYSSPVPNISYFTSSDIELFFFFNCIP